MDLAFHIRLFEYFFVKQRKNEERKRTVWHLKMSYRFLLHKHTLQNSFSGRFKTCKVHSADVYALNTVMTRFCRGKL